MWTCLLTFTLVLLIICRTQIYEYLTQTLWISPYTQSPTRWRINDDGIRVPDNTVETGLILRPAPYLAVPKNWDDRSRHLRATTF